MKKILMVLMMAAVLTGCGGDQETAKVANKDDLKGSVIGVQLGTTSDLLASDEATGAKEVRRFNKPSEAIKAMKQGQIDCVMVDAEVGKKFEKNVDGIKVLEDTFEPEAYAGCVKKGQTAFLNDLNGVLKEMEKNGEMQAIMDHHMAGKKAFAVPEEPKNPKGTLVMATNAEFEPYEYHGKDGICGIDIDIAKTLAHRLGYALEVQDMAFDSVVPSVQTGKADFGMAGLTVTEERKANVDFTDTYGGSKQVIIVNR